MYFLLTNQRYAALNGQRKEEIREELGNRVQRHHNFELQRGNPSWFTARWYLWIMYHVAQGELELMGYGPNPKTFAEFVDDPHFSELFVRFQPLIEHQHAQIQRRVHRTGRGSLDLTVISTWTDVNFNGVPIARRRRSNQIADEASRHPALRNWTHQETAAPTTDTPNVDDPTCSVCFGQLNENADRTVCCGQPAYCRTCLAITRELAASNAYDTLRRCPLCNASWPNGPSMI